MESGHTGGSSFLAEIVPLFLVGTQESNTRLPTRFARLRYGSRPFARCGHAYAKHDVHRQYAAAARRRCAFTSTRDREVLHKALTYSA